MEIYGRIIPRWRCSYLKQKYMYSTKIHCIQSPRLSFNSFRLFSFHFFFFALYVYPNLPRLKFTYLFANVSLVVLTTIQHYFHFSIIFLWEELYFSLPMQGWRILCEVCLVHVCLISDSGETENAKRLQQTHNLIKLITYWEDLCT